MLYQPITVIGRIADYIYSSTEQYCVKFTTHFRFHYISADKSQANLRVTALNMAKSELGNGGELLNFL